MRLRTRLFWASGLVVFAACTSPTNSGPTSTTVSYTMDSSTATQVSEFANSTYTSVTLNLGLGSTPKDVYLAFTNRGTASTTSKPSVTSSDLGLSANTVVASEAVADSPSPVSENDLAFSTRLPSVTRSASNVALSRSLSVSRSTTATTATASHPQGTSGVSLRYITYDNSLVSSHTFTLVSQVTNTAQNRILNVWVDSTLYGTTFTSGSTVTTAMADALAATFLASGTTTGSDIYSWDTGIFGREYYEPGTSVASDLVTPTGEINIVLADLNPNRANQGSFVYGYYWSANTFQSYVVAGQEASNASVSFYLDAPLFAKLGTGETTWALTNVYPSAMVSTLAHEFQHMIQYYQKQLRLGLGSTDTWINEMCSMVAEDLLADKMLVSGPRGVPLSSGSYVYSPGSLSTNDQSNRVAVFNRYYPTLPLTGSASYDAEDYSMAYSFGAWLARTYGGANLFREIVQNSGTTYAGVVDAVNTVNGTSVTWAQLLREWAASIVASTTVATSPYQVQAASPYYYASTLTSGVTGENQTYLLGSLDYSRYYAYGTNKQYTGPILSSSFTSVTSIPASGLYLLKPLSSSTGTHTLTLTLPASVDVTVVTKVSS